MSAPTGIEQRLTELLDRIRLARLALRSGYGLEEATTVLEADD